MYMNLYEYQRSRSFIDLHPMSLWFTFSNFFSLETSRPIEAKFHVEPPWDRGMKVCSNGLCHMTNMVAMPIYGKNLKKSSSLEPKGQWPWKFVCSIGYSSTSKFFQMMTLNWPWHILRQGQIWSLLLLYGKRVRYQSWYIQSTKWVHEPLWISKVKVIHWTSSKVTHIQHFQSCFAQKPLGWLKPNFILSLHEMWGMKICSHVPGHVTLTI